MTSTQGCRLDLEVFRLELNLATGGYSLVHLENHHGGLVTDLARAVQLRIATDRLCLLYTSDAADE